MTDYIKREDAKKWLTNLREDCGRYQDLWHYGEALDQIIDSLDTDVALVRHGEWKFDNETVSFFCSECNAEALLKYVVYRGCIQELSEYCPNCGARMDGESDE